MVLNRLLNAHVAAMLAVMWSVGTFGAGAQSAAQAKGGSSAVRIAPTTLGPDSTNVSGGDNSLSLRGFDLKSLIARTAGVSTTRVELPPSVDAAARYDVSVTVPRLTTEAELNRLILKGIEGQFHLVASRVSRPAAVYVVSALGDPPASFRSAPVRTGDSVVSETSVSFRLVTPDGQGSGSGKVGIDAIDGISIPAASLDEFCQTIEGDLDRPVVNETHLQGRFNFNLKSTSNDASDVVAQLRLKMNLDIQPANRTVEIMVFQAAAPGAAARVTAVRRPEQGGVALDWRSWLVVSCKLEHGYLTEDICSRSGLRDRRQGPSVQARRYPASLQPGP